MLGKNEQNTPPKPIRVENRPVCLPLCFFAHTWCSVVGFRVRVFCVGYDHVPLISVDLCSTHCVPLWCTQKDLLTKCYDYGFKKSPFFFLHLHCSHRKNDLSRLQVALKWQCAFLRTGTMEFGSC